MWSFSAAVEDKKQRRPGKQRRISAGRVPASLPLRQCYQNRHMEEGKKRKPSDSVQLRRPSVQL
ncbi:hypothetical protein KSP40_PGU002535 [Platanthera guangdongensis]|uniref:Uncharacterized protein n=1 Tax=Platanthera guangdongensis TaxID=2320717 RepID=A0ABR2M158_9ASPA